MGVLRTWPAIYVTVAIVAACSGTAPSATTTSPPTSDVVVTPAPTSSPATSAPPAPERRAVLFDTDVAGDDLLALTFLVSSPSVELVAVTVSGTGEAHCAGGVDVVLRLLERLGAPEVPVACGRETPLAGTHAFPDDWRVRADAGSGLELPATSRQPSKETAVQLITAMATAHPKLEVLSTGPLTNLADALETNTGLAGELGPVFIMGGALHVPGNLVCCGAPEGNAVAEWNIYVDPHAAQVVVASGLAASFVSLDGTNQVPVTRSFAQRATAPTTTTGGSVLSDLLAANPFMTQGGYSFWDPLAAELAAGYDVGSFTPASITVEEAEGPESGFTRPTDGPPNIGYLSTVDPSDAEDTLLRVIRN